MGKYYAISGNITKYKEIIIMSRIGKKPILIPTTVNVSLNNNIIIVKSSTHKLELKLPSTLNIVVDDEKIILQNTNNDKKTKAAHGLYRTLIQNMILGVTQEFSKSLIIKGIGYRAQMDQQNLILNVGYSHSVVIKPIQDTHIKVLNNNEISVHGINKTSVGQLAATIRAIKPPEPYKGKGIRYKYEYVKQKLGKTGK